MRLTTGSCAALAVVVLISMAMWPDPLPGLQPARLQAQKTAPDAPLAPSDSTSVAATQVELTAEAQRIRQELRKKADFDYADAPLKDVLESIAERMTVNVVIDDSELEDIGVDVESQPVSLSANAMSFDAALHHLLSNVQIAAVVQHEVLLITSIDRADSLTDSWDQVGGPASIAVFPSRGLLACSQTRDGHEQLKRLLEAMGRALKNPHAAPKQPPRDPAEVVVEVYELSANYEANEKQGQLIMLMERLLFSTDYAVKRDQAEHFIDAIDGKLIVSHRRDAQRTVQSLLQRLQALKPANANARAEPSGMF